MDRKVLISGGNGFLGSYVAEKFFKEKFSITVIDDLSTSKGKNLPENVKFIKEKVENYNDNEKYDYVLHLAARPSPEDYISHPVDTILSNSLGTLKMLEIARKGDSIFMYTSSSEVYGEATVVPTPENYYGYVNPNGIRSCYDEGKRFSEALIMAYHREYGLDVRIQRPFNVYGPRIREDGQYGRVIPRFIMQALKNEPLTVHGDGRQTRSFLYIDDWVNATWKFLIGKYKGEIINIGSDREITIIDLARKIISLTNSNSKIVFLPKRDDDPYRRAADLKKVKNLLGWEPKINLDEGLKKTIEWFKVRL
ncbi:MAG: NAD-dependent epimerase/dehydratase family protein [Thermoplasmata archaeon]